MTRIAVIDYGAGNLVSVRRALEVAGVTPRFATRGDDLGVPDLVVVPGVGASAPAMARLRRRGLERALVEAVESGAWYLGICLGLQLLFDTSDEDGARTLGLLPGVTRRLRDAPRLPHVGWNAVERRSDHPLFEGIAPGAPFYFVHSFAGEPTSAAAILAETDHGFRFTSAVAQGRLLGVQFHPERSGPDGLRLLRNALDLASGRGRVEPAAPTVAVNAS
jgi:imidazole glycerol phosphate synthase glutamine amidotransferase subunit